MQRDLVLRWLEQLRLLIARILRGERDASTELAEFEIDRAMAQMLGGAGSLVERLDPPSAASILADPDRIFAYAQVLGLKCALVRARGGSAPLADSLAQRALDMARQALQRAPDAPREWSEWIEAMENNANAPSN